MTSPVRPELSPQELKPSDSSAYWDDLSKIWLTSDALDELDRRNAASGNASRSPRVPLARHLQANQKGHSQPLTPDLVTNCEPEVLGEIKRIADWADPICPILGTYFQDRDTVHHRPMSANNSGNRKRRAESPVDSSRVSTKTTSTSAYNRNFEQKLIDHGIYPKGYEYPDGRVLAKPDNLEEINERLAQPRRSLSPSTFPEREFQKFEREDTNASKEKPVTTFVVPIIDGNIINSKSIPNPDHFSGARPERLDSQIRDELSNFIVPTTQTSLPISPNFFLEAKGPDGSPAAATRQACYNGALGARGMHKLHSYNQEPVYDSNAYTITSTYIAGTLKLYTTHVTTPREIDGRPEYIMAQLGGWSMTGDPETFRKGASAYRNARDWAKEQRDAFITGANERHRQSPSEIHLSEHEAASEQTVVLRNSETSFTSKETEFHDAAWSFAPPDGSIGALQASDERTKN